ncbi:hypothetical protein [uncultured Roseibium sp.]|uniref:hypothetical protein n=1 Tax=uncultured Roseibium sp. TaxID=1936171 RepID=UPI0026332A23|nr:hypothetical protein [uncultured Roseibium sp.]
MKETGLATSPKTPLSIRTYLQGMDGEGKTNGYRIRYGGLFDCGHSRNFNREEAIRDVPQKAEKSRQIMETDVFQIRAVVEKNLEYPEAEDYLLFEQSYA